jgi:predicted MFS family arabinose efflux permease
LDLIRGNYGKFLATYLIFHIAIYMAIPLHPILIVRVLKLSDRAISIGPILTYGILGLTSLLVSRYSARIADHRLVIMSVVLYGLQSFCLIFAQAADVWYWLSALSVGVGAALLGIGLTNRLMARVPEDDRPAHMALWTLAVYIGVLLGSALGPWVSEALGLRAVMAVTAATALLCTTLIKRWG